MELAREGEVYIIDSLPAPVCKRKRAWHCRKVRGKDYCGFCAAKNEKFFGWRLHLICIPDGVPVTFTLLPALHHDLTPLYELTLDLPAEASLYGDKGYNTAAGEQARLLDGLRLIPIRKANMTPPLLVDENALRRYRKLIETLNSQLESMGVEHLRARTNPGFEIKIHSSLLAVYFTNANWQSQ
jgi:IS5 family transposase